MEENIRLQDATDGVTTIEAVPAASESPAIEPTVTDILNASAPMDAKPTTSEAAPKPSQDVIVTNNERDMDSLLWILIGTVLAVAIVALVVGLLLRKRNKANKAQAMPKTIPLDSDDVVPPVSSAGLYEIGYAQTIGARENQEDAFGFVHPKPQAGQNEKLLAVVCDGMGGLDDGQIASNTAVKVLTNGFEDELRNGTPQSCLLNLCARAQNTVLAHNHKTGSNTGCTLVATLIKDGRLSFLSVGDSRICLYRNRALLQLNREHVLGQEMDEKQAFQGTGLNDPVRRRAITSHIGKENFSKVDRNVNPIQLMHGDKLLLMSDGLFGALSEDEILRELPATAQQAANRLIQAITAKQMPGQDNATIVIVSFP